MAQDYNKTLRLPQTDFAMRAALPEREPAMLEKWNEERVYYNMVEKNEGKPLYIFHDGPPYANGDIHMGTALNKVLKDIVVRSKNMMGYCAPFVPGWDTHGLPIELKALKKVGVDSHKNALEVRKVCKEFAEHYMSIQRNSFKRLGCLGDYDNPYLTLRPQYEAKQIEIFGDMMKKGYIYKGLKPVHWCPECETALAEAEIEHENDPCYSIYVKFNVKDDKGIFAAAGADLAETYFVIWTTTTWTLPANVAICLGPNFDYDLVKTEVEGKIQYLVIAKELVKATMDAAKVENYSTVNTFKGSELELMTCDHPFLDRESLIILGDHVTLESGTGCVHTAPGHGMDDFLVVKKYPELPIVVPVDDLGKMTEEAGIAVGLSTEDAGREIAKHIKESGHLLATVKLVHQYPHCWRCKEKILFRATEQWFCSVDGFKEDTLKAIETVEWTPAWGKERMRLMVEDRSDWCISRQRVWGVPIPVFYCESCGQFHADEASISAVSKLFYKEGSDAWYKYSAEEILPEGTVCAKCGGTKFRKESDIMDVWFDSGVSHAAVLENWEGQRWPADMYLEGSDQFRGWFQSALLTSVAWRKQAPYKQVCSVGWVVDGEGRKMSKSLGNGILAEDVVKEFGSDILRWWVASSDYHTDVRISKDILKQLSESYRKIRNTARFILGNLYDFEPDTDSVSENDMLEIDRWALTKLNEIVKVAHKNYQSLDFHVIFHAVQKFCTVDLSNFYLDILKDRLYVEKADSLSRRSAQTAIYQILRDITLVLTPILAYTSDEIWQCLPKSSQVDCAHPIYNQLPQVKEMADGVALMEKWERIAEIRDDINKAIELKRTEKIIGKPLEASVVLYATGELYSFVKALEADLPMIAIVSEAAVLEGDGGEFKGAVKSLSVTVKKAAGEKCERCWAYKTDIGSSKDHPTLCARCAAIVE